MMALTGEARKEYDRARYQNNRDVIRENLREPNRRRMQRYREEGHEFPSGPANNGYKLVRAFTQLIRKRDFKGAQIIARSLYYATGPFRKQLEDSGIHLVPGGGITTNYRLEHDPTRTFRHMDWRINSVEEWIQLKAAVAYKIVFYAKKSRGYWIFTRYLKRTIQNIDLPLVPNRRKCLKCDEIYECEGIGFVHKCDPTHYHVAVYKHTRKPDYRGCYEDYEFSFRIETLEKIPLVPPTFFVGHFFKFEGPYKPSCGLCNNDPSDYEISDFEDKLLEAA